VGNQRRVGINPKSLSHCDRYFDNAIGI